MASRSGLSREDLLQARRDVRGLYGGALLALLAFPWLGGLLRALFLGLAWGLWAFLRASGARRLSRNRASVIQEWRAIWGPPGAWTFLRALARPQPRQSHLLERAAQRGYLPAQLLHGAQLAQGVRGVRDPEGALWWFEAAARTGSPEGAFRLGQALVWGEGARRDPVAGRAWLRRASAGGHVGASQILRTLEGDTALPAAGDAQADLKALLDLPDRPGRLELALGLFQHRVLRWPDRFWQGRLRQGRLGVTLVGLGLLCLAGLSLYAPSLMRTGFLLLIYGAVLSPFLILLIRWISGDRVFQGFGRRRRDELRRRAQAGDPQACLDLGQRCLQGAPGVPQDSVEALAWLRRAAEGGEAEAMVRVADLLAYGPSQVRDRAEAWAWLERALALGHPEAGRRLSRMEVLR